MVSRTSALGPPRVVADNVRPYEAHGIAEVIRLLRNPFDTETKKLGEWRAQLLDVIRRYLEHRGYEVRHIQNFTDIDDKIINRANAEQIDPNELTESFIAEWHAQSRALNALPASHYPRATEEVGPIIETIAGVPTIVLGFFGLYFVAPQLLRPLLGGRDERRSLDRSRHALPQRKEHSPRSVTCALSSPLSGATLLRPNGTCVELSYIDLHRTEIPE